MNHKNLVKIPRRQINTFSFWACGHEFIIEGNLFHIVRARSEWDVDIDDPQAAIHEMLSQGVKADVFTFMQRLPRTEPAFTYRMKLDNIAAIPISNYEHWWTKQITQEARNKIRKAGKRGVTIRPVPFNDDLVHGIMEIYREAPLRRGVPFTHYNKSFDETKRANATFLERADFLGAYHERELIGFVKLVRTQGYTRVMGILAKHGQRDKAPMNALIAKAVDVCAEEKVPFLSYGKMVYGSKGIDSLAKFKQENGFLMYTLPRYFIPLTLRGRIGLALNQHKRFSEILPGIIVNRLIQARSYINKKRYGLASTATHSHPREKDKD